MKFSLFLIILISLTTFLSCGDDSDGNNTPKVNTFEVKGELYSIGTPSAEEVLALELINRARSNPEKEGLFLASTGQTNIESTISYFNVDKEMMKSAFETYDPIFPLAFNEKLNIAANTTSQMMIDNDTQAHVINGVDPGDRITDAGYIWSGYGENIYAYSEDVVYGHAGFNIDWGYGDGGMQTPPGHRHNIMGVGSGHLKEIGISIIIDNDSSTDVGPQVTSHDFGSTRSNSYNFITGVVYDDINGNNFYDIGEGIGGVTVSADNGFFYAITTESGAYTIPFSSTDGITKVQAFSDTFSAQIVEVNLQNENYKLDFNVQKTGANGDGSVGYNGLDLNGEKSVITTVPKGKKYRAPE